MRGAGNSHHAGHSHGHATTFRALLAAFAACYALGRDPSVIAARLKSFGAQWAKSAGMQ